MADESTLNILARHSRTFHKEKGVFARTFGASLSDYWDKFTWFDITKFDDEVVKSGDDCMEDVVRARWGDDAVALVFRLIDANG